MSASRENSFANLELVLVCLERSAHATTLWAHLEHELLIAIALAFLQPPGTRFVMIRTYRRAQIARIGALACHEIRILNAFATIRPNLAFSSVAQVNAVTAVTRAHIASCRAYLEHKTWVRSTLAVSSPRRATLILIFATWLADATAHRALACSEVGVLVALTKVCPTGAFWQGVLAFRCTDAAGSGAAA